MADEVKEKEPESNEEQPVSYGKMLPLDKEVLTLRAELAKERQQRQEENNELKMAILEKDLQAWTLTSKMMRVIPPAQRKNWRNTIKAAVCGEPTVEIEYSKGIQVLQLGDAIKSLLEMFPPTLISTTQFGGAIPNQFDDVPITNQEKGNIALSKMRKVAAEKGWDMNKPDEFTKAENAVRKTDPDLFELEEVN